MKTKVGYFSRNDGANTVFYCIVRRLCSAVYNRRLRLDKKEENTFCT